MHDWFKRYNNFTDAFSSCRLDPQSQDMPTEGVSRGRSVAVAVGVSDQWQVTCDMLHVTRDM